MAGDPDSRRNSHQSFDVSSHSIPLRDLGSPPAQPQSSQPASASHDSGPSLHPSNLPAISTYWDGPHQQHPADPADLSPSSPIDPAAFSYALPPDINSQLVDDGPPAPFPYITETPYYDETSHPDYFESDSAPLTASAEPISGTLDPRDPNSQARDSFQTISDGNSPGRSRGRSANMLGFDLESGFNSGKHSSYGQSLSPTGGRSRAGSTTDALLRAGSMVRAMSQRVVNISGEGDAIEQQQRRDRSRSPSIHERNASARSSYHAEHDTSYPSQLYPESPLEKAETHWTSAPVPHQPAGPRLPMVNPLKGRSLGVFPPESPIRKRLCDLLVHPLMEPLLLVLIVFQTILLAVQSAHNVYDDGYGRPPYWDAKDWTNWAQLILFIIFTMETAARVVVSGFLLNAAEYSSVDRQRGWRLIVADWYNTYFKDQQQGPVKPSNEGMGDENYGPATFARSFTMMHGQRLPETVEEQQRMQLARRAFLRHGFNRLDFVAVVSYWITFVLSITGIEAEYHIYIFRMMSCLRIVRLLALTNGTSIILRSLKKAAPMLLRVSFLLGFFWLVFAIIGVQSFKSSFGRQCVWLDPLQPKDFSAAFTNSESFCGGHLDNSTGDPQPWVKFTIPEDLDSLQDGTGEGKGFLCPRGSICLEQESPSGGTVKFDDIVHSLELVFVIMSANTWSDLMYQTTKSDFLPAALFFGFGIMIMMLWLTNLMIAVITSAFQVIREESKTSAFTDTQEPLMPVAPVERGKRLSTLQKVYHRTKIIWIFIIAFDLLCQSLRSNDMTDDRRDLIAASAVIVCVLLDIEIAIRFAIDWRSFHRKVSNLFDLGLAVANTIILFPPIRNSGLAYDWLTIFQILRAYRVVMAIPITRQLILLVLGNAAGIANLILFVFLITFIMAIFACQLFRGEIPLHDDGGELIEISFYNIFNSFIGMYQILSSENWTSMLYNVTAYLTVRNTSWYGAAFLIGWFTLAWFIIINMFIAVIQENFDVSEDEKRLEQVKAFLQMKELGAQATSTLALSEIFSFRKKRKQKDPLDYGPATMEMLLKDAVVREFLDESVDTINAESDEQNRREQERTAGLGVLHSTIVLNMWNKIRKPFVSHEPNPFYEKIRFDGSREAFDPRQMARQVVSAASERRKAQREYLARHPNYNNSLYIFTPTNPIRRMCQRLVGPGRGTERFDGVEPNKIAWYSFSALMFAAVVAMVVLACVTTPLYQKEYWEAHEFEASNWFVWIDTSFAILFSVEAIIKIIADGWLFTPNAYYRSSWGIIDGIVLVSLWVNVVTTLAQGGMITGAVGVVKAFRALRLLNVSNSARDTFHSLIIVAGWKIVSAALVSLSLLIPFAIYATTLFNGKMVICNDGDVTTLTECFGEYEASPFNNDAWNFIAPRVAENPYYSFDDFGSSLFILFQIVSQEGWVDVSFSAQSITDRGLQPQEMASVGNALFFVAFNLLGTVFVLTLFISVFMRNYTEQTGVAYLTADQRSWLELRKLLRQIAPSRSSYDDTHEKPWRRWCHKRAIEKHGKWYLGNTVILVLHLILLMLEYYPEPDWWRDTRNGIFLFFTFIYIANIAIRVIGLGWSRFRKSSWDIYSIFAVAGAFTTSIMSIASQSFEPLEQLHKYFLVAIVLLLIPRNDALDQLFKTAAASFTTILNLLITWLVFFLVFGIALTQTLGLTRFGGSEDSDVNVRTVPQAMILLFRMSTGEGWNELMEDFADITPPLCVEDHLFFQSDCGSPTWARFLFIAWNIISMYIFVNLFISLIYESFSYVYQQSSGLAHVDRDDIRRFKEAWRSVDPTGTGFISTSDFPKLLAELSGIFDMRVYGPEDSIGQIIRDVRNETHRDRHTSIGNPNAVADLDINRLNERLAKIDIQKARERRRIYKIFYEEIKVSADPDRGISFTTVLMIMAHYKIINDSKSLKLEEFLRRRARLQRVEEEVRRRVVIGFFDTLYWSRYFKRHMEKKKSGRMAGVPQLDVPDIFVDDEEEREQGTQHRATIATQSVTPSTTTADGHLAAGDSSRPTHKSWSPSIDISTYDSSMVHPLAAPRASPSTPGNPLGDDGANFNLQDPGLASNDEARRGSSVSPGEVRGLLDDSVWVESIRRSATVRKSVRKSNRSFQ